MEYSSRLPPIHSIYSACLLDLTPASKILGGNYIYLVCKKRINWVVIRTSKVYVSYMKKIGNIGANLSGCNCNRETSRCKKIMLIQNNKGIMTRCR